MAVGIRLKLTGLTAPALEKPVYPPRARAISLATLASMGASFSAARVSVTRLDDVARELLHLLPSEHRAAGG